MSRFFRSALFPLIVIVLLVYLASQTLLPSRSNDTQKMTYSQLISLVGDNPRAIESIVFAPKGRQIQATLTSGKKVKVNYPTDQSQILFQEELQRQDVPFDSKGTGSSALWSIVTYALPFLIFLGFWIFLMNQVQGGGSKVM
ncbi:MAG: ATP-dependent metallopeptidase FtsH/Yme1/Tma family protein, partial [Gaiellaceae bacterium]